MSDIRNALVQKIAAKLGETEADPIAQIGRLVEVIGPEKVIALVREAREIYAGDGLLICDGSRKRSLGGCFFWQARNHAGLTKKQRRIVFLPYPKNQTAPAIEATTPLEQGLFLP